MSAKARFKWTLMLPVGFAVLCFAWVRRAFVRPKAPAEARNADQARQSQVRRKLRGLPAEHDQTAYRA